ncbi:MAG: ATP-binding protein [Patescibacteria group bacterium]|mgnify:CR=1 FL=1
MHVRLHSLVLHGLEGQVIDVEVDVASGFPQFLLVGLADTVVQEARERVRSALKNSGYRFPDGRVTVSLSPSHVRKEGAWFDLPIALGILLGSGQIHDAASVTERAVFCAELGLDGSVRATAKELAQVMSLESGQKARPAVLARGALDSLYGVQAECCGVGSLREVADGLDAGTLRWGLPPAPPVEARPFPQLPKLKGMACVERAMQVALVGRHHAVLYGPPGTGKSVLSQLTCYWNPDLSTSSALQVGQVWSAAGMNPAEILTSHAPPFRAPHHTASAPAMVGGGQPLRAGEISLSHHGILFLDELPEFRREVLEALREPLQEGVITINRANGSATFPAQTQVIATLNPCPCGFWGDAERTCTCSGALLEKYRRKLSGPLLDRFALSIRVDRVSAQDVLQGGGEVYTHQEIQMVRVRVQTARQVLESQVRPDVLSSETQEVLVQAADTFSLSPRTISTTCAVARSIAALDGRVRVTAADMAEALQYRWRGWTEG